MKDIGVNEGTDTVTVADGTATVDATITGTTTDPGKLTDGTATGIPRATIDNMCAAATIGIPRKRKSAELNSARGSVALVQSIR